MENPIKMDDLGVPLFHVKKWCKSWLPSSGLMWQASSEHAALAAKAWICHGPVWPMKNMEIPWNGSWLKRSNFFWGEGFLDGNSPLSSRLGFVRKLVIFFKRDSKPWDSSQLDGGFFFFLISPLLGGKCIQFWPLFFQIFVEVETTKIRLYHFGEKGLDGLDRFFSVSTFNKASLRGSNFFDKTKHKQDLTMQKDARCVAAGMSQKVSKWLASGL